jgi:hypothetical protein
MDLHDVGYIIEGRGQKSWTDVRFIKRGSIHPQRIRSPPLRFRQGATGLAKSPRRLGLCLGGACEGLETVPPVRRPSRPQIRSPDEHPLAKERRTDSTRFPPRQEQDPEPFVRRPAPHQGVRRRVVPSPFSARPGRPSWEIALAERRTARAWRRLSPFPSPTAFASWPRQEAAPGTYHPGQVRGYHPRTSTSRSRMPLIGLVRLQRALRAAMPCSTQS